MDVDRDEHPPEPPFGEIIREKLRAYWELEELTDEQDELLRELTAVLEHITSLLKTPVEETDPELLEAKAKITERRNERMKERIEELEEENEQLSRKVKAYGYNEITNRYFWQERVSNLESEVEKLRAENARLREELADESELSDAQRLARAVKTGAAAAYRREDQWNGPTQFLGCLSAWAEDHAPDEMATSERTIRRRLKNAGLWAFKPNGECDVKATVENCNEAASP